MLLKGLKMGNINLRQALESEGEDKGWVGFDLDATLAKYTGWQGIEHIGEPIPNMIALLKDYLAKGYEVRIMTARVSHEVQEENQKARRYIEKWCLEHIGQALRVTCIKDMRMKLLYDDRVRQVVENEGIVVA